MNSELALFGWTIPADEKQNFPETLRMLERTVREEAGPALRNPVVQEHAVAYRLCKYTKSDTRQASLSVIIVAPIDAKTRLVPAVERHFSTEQTPMDLGTFELLLHPIAAEYRRGLREVTDIGLDLHAATGEQLEKHQCFLIELGCTPTDPRFALHQYLEQHSPSYSNHGSLEERSRNPWKHEEFWTRLFTPGPAVELSPPIRLLWNILTGLTPQRWSNAAEVAKRIGISC